MDRTAALKCHCQCGRRGTSVPLCTLVNSVVSQPANRPTDLFTHSTWAHSLRSFGKKSFGMHVAFLSSRECLANGKLIPFSKENVMEMSSLQDLYVEELRDLYNAENQLVKALPKMAKAAT